MGLKGAGSPEGHLACMCRLSSDIFPWCTEYQLKELKDFEAISDELAFAGKLARAYDQRLTFHPSHFVKLAAETDELLNKSIKELEVHSMVRPFCLYTHAYASVHSSLISGQKLTECVLLIWSTCVGMAFYFVHGNGSR